MTSMRAWEYHGNRRLIRVQRPIPQPGPDEVRVRIAYTGICGTDLHEYYEGPVVTELGHHDRTGASAPIIPGHEASGTVDAVGSTVSGVAVGDRVAIEPIWAIPEHGGGYNVNAVFHGYHAHGFLADYGVVKATSVHRLPDTVSLADGALVEPLAVAVHAVQRARVQPDDSVVVFGGGPIGLGLATVLRAQGIDRLTVVEPAKPRSDALRRLGFPVLDPHAEHFLRRLEQATGGPARVVFDAAGAPAVLDTALQLLCPRGTLVLVATYPRPVGVNGMTMIGKELSIAAVNAYERGDFGTTIDLIAGGGLRTAGWVQIVGFDDVVSIGYPALHDATAAKVLVAVGGEAR